MLNVGRHQGSQARRHQQPAGHYDRLLLGAATILAGLGVVMVASSSIAVAPEHGVGEFYYLRRQLLFLVGGAVAAMLLARIELKNIEKWHFVLLLAGIAFLAATFLPVLGVEVNGARRWVNLGLSNVQPVELVKLLLVVYLASYLVRHRDSVQNQFTGAVKPLGVALLIGAMLVAQPDFGSAALLLAVTLSMIWLGGARMRNLVYMSAPLVPVAYWLATSEDYRVQRLTSFLNPWADPFNNGYQLVQALIAIGRGEWFGVGLGGSVQKLSRLPEGHTDFIVAVIGEELGLAGIVLVVTLFSVLVWRGMATGLKGVQLNQHFAGYLAYGISLTLGLQALVSIGVNLGVLPTKGLTLPLISYGGSSEVMTCVMLGVLARCTFEVNRAQETRRMAVRRSHGAAAPESSEPAVPAEEVAS